MALLESLASLNWHSPWVIGGVVVAGAALAFFVVPKLKAASAAQSAAATGPNETTASQTPGPGIIILQQDTPTGPDTSGGMTTTTPGTGGTVAPGPSGGVIFRNPDSGTGSENPGGLPGQVPMPIVPAPRPTSQAPQPPSPPKQFVHPQAWPSPQGSISGIAQAHGTTAARLEAFPENAYIGQRSGGWNRIYPSDTIRIA